MLFKACKIKALFQNRNTQRQFFSEEIITFIKKRNYFFQIITKKSIALSQKHKNLRNFIVLNARNIFSCILNWTHFFFNLTKY